MFVVIQYCRMAKVIALNMEKDAIWKSVGYERRTVSKVMGWLLLSRMLRCELLAANCVCVMQLCIIIT